MEWAPRLVTASMCQSGDALTTHRAGIKHEGWRDRQRPGKSVFQIHCVDEQGKGCSGSSLSDSRAVDRAAVREALREQQQGRRGGRGGDLRGAATVQHALRGGEDD